jgi:hypothetical protein
MAWKPTRDEAQFIGEVMAIDAGLAQHVTDLLRKGNSLTSVRGTLSDAMRIVSIARGELASKEPVS